MVYNVKGKRLQGGIYYENWVYRIRYYGKTDG